jgi:NDP-sugar pyrophosphorylase family protein
MSLPVVVLAGGLATRLGPLAEGTPKILIDVAGRPFAEHQLDLLARAGITDVVYCIGHHGDQVVAALGDGSRWGMRFRFVPDGPKLLGTGGAIRQTLPYVGPEFFVMYGDSYLDCDYAAIEQTFRASGKAGLMTVFRNDDRFDRSNVEFSDGQIVVYDKRNRTPAMRHIDYGLGVLTAGAFEARTAAGAETPGDAFDLADVYQYLVARGELAGYEVSTRFYEIGSPEGLADTRALLSARAGRSS